MKRKIAILIGAAAACAITAAFLWPRERIVFIGPHKVAIEFVPYDRAHSKPWIDFTFFGKRLAHPVPLNLPGADRHDDPRFISGYLVVSAPDAEFRRPGIQTMAELSMFARINRRGPEPDQVAVPVTYPMSRQDAKDPLILAVGLENIQVTRVYDPTRIPAEYGDASVKTRLGPLNISARIAWWEHDEPWVNLRVACERFSHAILRYHSSEGQWQESGKFPIVLPVPGKLTRSGTIEVDGSIHYMLGDITPGMFGGTEVVAELPIRIELKPSRKPR